MPAMPALLGKEPEFFARPMLLDDLCLFVAGGGTAIDFAELHDVRSAVVMRWLTIEPARKIAYDEARVSRAEWAEQLVYGQLRALAQFKIQDLMNEDGSLKPVGEWPADAAKAIEGLDLEQRIDGKGEDATLVLTKKLKLGSRRAAVESLGKLLGLYKEKVQHDFKLEDILELSRKDDAK